MALSTRMPIRDRVFSERPVMPRCVVIIPSRYASSRFPGKPLVPIAGKPMIQHVYERARQARLVDGVIVATDDQRIVAAVEACGGQAVLTSPTHPTGTDRIAEVAQATLEQVEQLEQLRVLEHGYRIRVVHTTYESVGVDTPEDVARAERLLANLGG